MAVEIVAKGALGILTLSSILNLFISISMNEIFGMFVFLQFTVAAPLINAKFPANARSIFEILTQAATFDMLYTDNWFPLVFGF
jgi:hypothetical protein